MKPLVQTIKSHLYKSGHTGILWVHVCVPVLAIVVFGGYYAFSAWEKGDKIMTYVQAVAMAFPFMAALVVTMQFEADGKAGGGFALLSVPFSKRISHLGNLLSLLIFGGISSVLAMAGVDMVLGGILLFANIGIYLIQYMVCYSFGKSVSLGLGMVNTLLGMLLLLGLGERVWKYVPCSYGIRLSSYYVTEKLQPEQFLQMAMDYHTGFVYVTAITLLLFAVFFLWAGRWQGMRESH